MIELTIKTAGAGLIAELAGRGIAATLVAQDTHPVHQKNPDHELTHNAPRYIESIELIARVRIDGDGVNDLCVGEHVGEFTVIDTANPVTFQKTEPINGQRRTDAT